MTATETSPTDTAVVYDLEGTLLEACSCAVLCPCWIGEDPDHGTCDAFNAYHFSSGVVRGVDVSGLSIALTPGSWRVVLFIDDRATAEQEQALLDAYTGKLGGPLADLAGLVGEVVAVERASIVHETVGGLGTLRVGDFVEGLMAPYLGPDGSTTTLRDSVFSTVPGSPAYVAKAELNRVDLPQYGMQWSFEGRNAIQSDYHIRFAKPGK